MHTKKVAVHSDGFGAGTVVIDEDGNQIEGVKAASIELTAGEPNRISMEIWMPRVQVSAHPQEILFICPCCGEDLVHECSSGKLGP